MKIEVIPMSLTSENATAALAGVRIKPETPTDEYALRNLMTNKSFILSIENVFESDWTCYKAIKQGT